MAPNLQRGSVRGRSGFTGRPVHRVFDSSEGSRQCGRHLGRRMEGKPFALLGVNGDGDKDKLREWMKKEEITWRTWWDGGGSANTPGPISRQYNVSVWPMFYVLDHRGVIRYKFLGTPGNATLDAAVNALIEGVKNDRTVE